MSGRRRLRKQSRPQSIWDTFCPEAECFTVAGVLSSHDGAVVTYDGVLFSRLYYASYVWEETVAELGHTATVGGPAQQTPNPRGGVFESVGTVPLYLWLSGRPDPVLVEFQVLPGPPAEAGVRFIVGNPDIEVIWGEGWTPEENVLHVAGAA